MDFTFWHLQTKRWHKTSIPVIPTNTVEEMKVNWFDNNTGGIELRHFYSFVYNGIILENDATLAGE